MCYLFVTACVCVCVCTMIDNRKDIIIVVNDKSSIRRDRYSGEQWGARW